MNFKLSYLLFFILVPLIFFVSCAKSDDSKNEEVSVDDETNNGDEVTITVSDFTTTIDENPSNGQLIGTIDAITTSGSINFNLKDQNPIDALEINQETGAIIVADAFYFNYEIHSIIQANVEVVNGELIEEVSINININDILEDIVNIYDPNFKYALINYNVVDLNNDGVGDVPADQNNDSEIQISEAEAISSLEINDLTSIESLRGIESFTNLNGLFCQETSIRNLDKDLRYNLELQKLRCLNIQDPELNFSNNSSLQYLICGANDLETLNVIQNTELLELNVSGSSLSGIDLSENINLRRLKIKNSQLKTLDVSQNTLLLYLSVDNTRITEVDLRSNPILIEISCGWNDQLESVTLGYHPNLLRLVLNETRVTEINVSRCPSLRRLSIGNALLTDLDISNNPNIWDLDCYGNQLTSLNIKNGNNSSLDGMSAHDNPSLTCIQVDDVSIANSKPYWNKDATASYNEICL